MSCCSDAPLGQSVPRLIGWSGSPSTWTTCGVTFFALSPIVWMMTPQLTEQYGHVLRVSVEREIFRLPACASSGCASKPKTVIPTAPAMPVLKNARLDTSITQPSMTKDLGTVNWCRDGTQALEKRKGEAAIKVCAVRSTSKSSRIPTTPNHIWTQTMRKSVYRETCAGQIYLRGL